MEVNVKFPANVRFAYLPGFTATDSLHDGHMEQCPFDSEKRGHVYGCSLAYQVHDLMWPRNYEILYLESNNAVYYDKRKKIPGLQDNVPLSMTELYQRGYWSMPNRRDSFSFNNELEPWQQYKAGEIFSYLQKTPLPFHGNHHVVIGDLVNNGFGPQPSLQHGCFDPNSSALNDAESDSGSCTWTVLPSRWSWRYSESSMPLDIRDISSWFEWAPCVPQCHDLCILCSSQELTKQVDQSLLWDYNVKTDEASPWLLLAWWLLSSALW